MKLSKKLIASVLMAVMLLTSSTCVFAKGSRTDDVILAGAQAAYYLIEQAIEKTEDYIKLLEKAPEIPGMIDQVNAAKDKMEKFADLLADFIEKQEDGEAKTSAENVAKAIEGKEFVTPFFDLIPVGDVEKNSNGNYEVTMNVPAFTDKTTGVQVIHYSDERMLWEVIEPTSVDVKAKNVTVEFKDLSPVAIIADKGTTTAADSQPQGTSPKTEDGSSAWMMWMGAAFVLLAAGSVVVYRRKKC